MFVRKFTAAARAAALLGVLGAALALSGCSSCKDFEVHVGQLDAQIALLQQDLTARDAMIAERDGIVAALTDSLTQCNGRKAALIEKVQEVIMVTIPDQVSFPSKGVQVLDSMVPTLQAVADAIRPYPGWNILVEAYTDGKELDEELMEYYPTNWELGATRACAVARYLITNLGVSADVVGAATYANFRPFGDNETKEGRDQNRVVRLVLRKPGT